MLKKKSLFVALSILAILAMAVLPASAQLPLPSDEFLGTSLGAHWIDDPLQGNLPASEPFSVAGGKLSIAVPAGVKRTLSDSNVDAPRILQAVNDPQNFTITIKVDTPPNTVDFAGIVGIVLKGTYDLPDTTGTVENFPTYIRASLDTYDAVLNRINGFATFHWFQENEWQTPIRMINGPDQTILNQVQSAGPVYLRLSRETAAGRSTFRVFWSKDGTTWSGDTLGGEFEVNPNTAACGGFACNTASTNFKVSHIGVFAGTTGANPAYTAVIDWFLTTGIDASQPLPPSVTLEKIASPLTRVEPGGAFDFTLNIHNTSSESVTITELTDDSATLSTACTDLIGNTLTADQTVSCSYSVSHTAVGSYTNTASVTVENGTGVPASDTASATVTVTSPSALPSVALTKVVDQASLPLPGGLFTYTLTIANTSAETVTISALTDTSALPTACTDLIGDTLATGASVSCVYGVTRTTEGSFVNTAEVTVVDADMNEASDTATVTVTVTGAVEDEFPIFLPFISKNH